MQSIRLATLGQFSMLFLVLILFIILCKLLYDYEQDLTRSYFSLYSRANSRIEIVKYFLVILMTVSHFYIHESIKYLDHLGAHLGVCLVSCTILLFLFIYYLPYYHFITNFTHAAAYGSTALFVLGELISWFFKDINILLEFFIFITPLIVYILLGLINKRVQYIKNHASNPQMFIKSLYESEICLRFLIQDLIMALEETEHQEFVQDIQSHIKEWFKELRKQFYFHKLVSILEFLYIFSVLEDDNLARLKLSFTKEGKFDLEYNYGEFKCRRIVEERSKTYCEELDFIKFRKMYEKVLKSDEKTCLIQTEFWTELGNDIINTKKIETLSYSAHRLVGETYKLGKELYEVYPENAAPMLLYGGFLSDIYNEPEKGNELLLKSEHIRKTDRLRQQIETRLSYFDQNAGVMIVSGSPDSVGMVEYVSHEAYSILGLNIGLRLNLHIANFSPPPMDNIKLHNKSLIRFLTTRNSYEVDLPLNNLLMSSDGFLVEVFIQIKCLALDSYPFFLVSMRRAKVTRECILFDSENCITAHTKLCASLLRFRDSAYLKGMRIDQVIPGLVDHIQTQGSASGYEYDTPYERIYVRFEEKYTKSIVFRVLYLTNSFNEAKTWGLCYTEVPIDNYLKPDYSLRKLSQRLMKLGSVFMAKRGIIKNSKFYRFKKNLRVHIYDIPSVHILPITDFKAGKYKAAKDAPKIEITDIKDPPDSKDIENSDVSLASELCNVEKKAISMGKILTTPKFIQNSLEMKSPINSISSSSLSASTSIKAQKLIRSVNTATRRFKIAFILTNVLVILAISAMITYLILQARFYQEDMLISHICTLRSNTVTLTEYVRYLQLHKLLSQDPNAELLLRSKLTDTVEEFDYYIKSLVEKLEKRPDEESDPLYEKKISTFLKEDNKYITKRDILLDALRALNLEAKMILSTPSEFINPQNPHFYYIMRNGVEETSKYLNETVNIFLEIERQNLAEMTEIVNYLGVSEVFLIIICFIGVIIPTLIRIERANQDVWRFFYSLSIQVIHEMKFKYEERLETVHGIEQTRKPISSRFKNIKLRKKTRNSYKWKQIIFKLSIYYLCSSGIFIYIYAFLLVEFTEVISQKPDTLNWASMIISSIEEGFFWGTEVSYINTTFNYFSIVPEQQVSHPLRKMNQLIDLWDYSEKILITELNLAIKSSEEQQYVLFVNGCVYPPCQVYLHMGLHPALIKIRAEVPLLVSIALPFEWAFGNMMYKEEVNNSMKHLLTLYEDILNGMIEICVSKMKGVVITYCIVVLLLNIFIYIPALNKIRAEVTDVWDNSKLIPYSLIIRSQKDKV